MYLLGYDIGTSSVKASIVDAQTGQTIKSAQYPDSEAPIIARQTGWAEQEPQMWWNELIEATKRLGNNVRQVAAIGISYQMHGLVCAVDAGMLGSIDANRGDYQNGWDTDQFPIDNFDLTQAWMEIIRGGGFVTGGTNFDAKTRRNSTDLEDIIIAHISGMDAMARGLESAAKLLEESPYKQMKADRYASFDSGMGKDFEDGKLTFEQVYEYGKQNGEPKQTSGKQELYETIVSMYA